jgi:hypothetical protein
MYELICVTFSRRKWSEATTELILQSHREYFPYSLSEQSGQRKIHARATEEVATF